MYILNRPQKHIRDYKIETDIQGKINIELDSDTDVSFVLENEKGEIYSGDSKTITVEKPDTLERGISVFIYIVSCNGR